MIFRILVILALQIVFLFSQDFSIYKQLINEGKIEEVLKSLPYLASEYPEHPFILYLNTSMNSNGEEANEQYQSIIEKYPGTDACELSIMKVGELLYSKGLYTQASEQLKMIPLQYPNSMNIRRAVDLMKKSYSAIGEKDSLDLYINLFSKKYPEIDFTNFDYYATIKNTDVVEEVDLGSSQEIIHERAWVVQVGAFGEKKNADILVGRLKSAGFDVEIFEKSDQISLYLVQIVRYSTAEQAKNVGMKVQNEFGLDFRILERN